MKIDLTPKKISVAKSLLSGIEYEEVALAYIIFLEESLDYISENLKIQDNCICKIRDKGKHHSKQCKKVQDAIRRYEKNKK